MLLGGCLPGYFVYKFFNYKDYTKIMNEAGNAITSFKSKNKLESSIICPYESLKTNIPRPRKLETAILGLFLQGALHQRTHTVTIFGTFNS